MPSDARKWDDEELTKLYRQAHRKPENWYALYAEARRARASEAALREEVERLQAENHSLKGGIHDDCPDPYQKIRVLEARLSAFEHVQREISPEYSSGEGASGGRVGEKRMHPQYGLVTLTDDPVPDDHPHWVHWKLRTPHFVSARLGTIYSCAGPLEEWLSFPLATPEAER